MQSNPQVMKSIAPKLFRKVLVGMLSLAIAALIMQCDAARARLDRLGFKAAALQNEQPQVGPGVPRVGSNAAKSAAGSSKAGSLLFFHKYTSNTNNPSNTNTLASLTNTNPRDGVTLRLFFVRDCQVASQFINLAANQTRTLLMSIEDPGRTGYIVAVAVNSLGVPAQFNWLIGAASLRDAQGHEAAYNAVGVAKRTGGAAAVAEGASFAEIKFDDSEYDRLPQQIAIDNIQSQDLSFPEGATRTDVSVYSPLADLRASETQSLKFTAIAYDQSGRPYPQVFDNACGLNVSVSNIWNNPGINSYIQPNRPGWGAFAATAADNTPLPLLGISFSDAPNQPQRDARPMQALNRLESFSMKLPLSFPNSPAADVATSNQPDATGGAQGASEMKPGSALVFPRFASGAHGSSRVNLTNTHPTRKVRVRVAFSGLADATAMAETVVALNPNQTTSLDSALTLPNQKGWVFATAIDPKGLPLKFNYLIGSAQVREATGAAFGYNALAVAKNSPGSVPRNGDATTADILFNDMEYDRLPSTLGLAAVFSQQDNATTLGYARPPLNLLDPVNTRGSVLATAFDELLAQASATIGGIEAKLATVRSSALSPSVVNSIVKGKRGWLKLAPGAPIFAWQVNTPAAPFTTAPGSANWTANWTGGFNGGSTLHILTSTESYTLKTMATNPNNQAPIANFEPIAVYHEARSDKGAIVRLDGRTSSDPNPDDPLTYEWFDNDARVSTAPVSDFRLGPGMHVVKLIVTDGNETPSEAKEAIVEVRDTTPPRMSGIPSNITKTTGSLAGAALNYPLPVAWDYVDGKVHVSASKNPGAVFPIGRTIVTFTARDNAGNETKATMEVNVKQGTATLPTNGGIAGNKLPYLNNLNDQYVVAGKVRQYVLSAADDDGNAVTFALQNAPDYAKIDSIDPVARKATLTIAPTAGAQAAATNVRVVATDSRGGVFATLPFLIQISDVENDETGSGKGPDTGGGGTGGGGGGGGGGGNNRAPIARAAALAAQFQATTKQGAIVKLDGSASSDPDGDSLSYKWYDNGQLAAEGAIVDAAFAVGTHALVLTVTDDKGASNSTAARNFEVLPRPLSLLSASPARIDNFGYTTMIITGTGFVQGTQVRFDCTSFCQGGSQIAITINSLEEDKIVLTARTTQKTPLGNRDCVVTNPGGGAAKLLRSNFVAN